jgi:hypothetical protein
MKQLFLLLYIFSTTSLLAQNRMFASQNKKQLAVYKSTSFADGLTSATASNSAYQIKQDYPSATDGLYWIKNSNINGGAAFQIYADMTTAGGGWTLIMQNNYTDWNDNTGLLRNQSTPPAILANGAGADNTKNYSIIQWADYLKSSTTSFQYMLEANSRGRNGGIWQPNENYSIAQIKKENVLDSLEHNIVQSNKHYYIQTNNNYETNEYETNEYDINDNKINQEVLDNTWKSCCLTVDKSAIKYFVQVSILFFLIILSSTMLVIDQNCNNQRNWSALLTLCLGVFIKAPSIGNK